jgi:Mrp family chromosome partitioning ATPase
MTTQDIDFGVLAPASAMADVPPLYGAEQDFRRLEASSDELGQRYVFGFRSGDSRARPFKLLRTRIAKLASEQGVKLIGVTSAAPNVGKTFVTANLSAALSRLVDTHVCALDLDMHRPALGPRFGVNDGQGIHDYLSGDTPDIRTIGRQINEERLVLIPGFRRDVATGELLSGPRGDALFASLRALPPSTLVIIDMPPIFADDDAVIIANRIDGYLLVVEDGRTTKKQVEETMRMLAPAPMLGTVLNRYNRRLFNDDYGYGVSYGYGAYY